MPNNIKKLSKFKKQIGDILKKVNNFDEADKNEALKYLRQCIETDERTPEHDTKTPDLNTSSKPRKPCSKKRKSCIDTFKEKLKTKLKKNKSSSKPKPSKKASKQKKTKQPAEKSRSSRRSLKIKYKTSSNDSKEQVKPAVFKCRVCSTTKRTKLALFKHLESHPGTAISCIKCKKSFMNEFTFDWHAVHLCQKKVRNNSQSNKFKCAECFREFEHKRHFQKHVEGHKRNNCSYCDIVLTRRIDLVRHMLTVHSVKLENTIYKCEHCEKQYAKKRSLYYHLRQHLPDKSVCLQCGHLSNTVEEYNEHVRLHEEKKPWECSKCKDKFSRKQQYLVHMKRHDRYQCLTCNKTYASRARIVRHKQRGHDVLGLEPKLQCPQCDRAFHRNIALQIHMRKHSGDSKSISCKCCARTFGNPYQYYKHCMTAYHDRKSNEINQLVCENCGKRFTKKYMLEQHLRRIHKFKGEPFTCNFCEYQTSVKANWVRHMALHLNNQEQFICEHCGKVFSTAGNLMDHVSYIHVQEKLFKCDKCEKSFKRNSELVRHFASHSDVRPHICETCGSAYKRMTHLKRHEANAHKTIVKTRHVQRMTRDDTGALVPVAKPKKKPAKEKKQTINTTAESNEQIFTLILNGLSDNYCPVPMQDLAPKPIDDNLLVFENAAYNQQEFWDEKLNLQKSGHIFTTDGSNLGQISALSVEGSDLNALNIVDQLVNSFLPVKDMGMVQDSVYNEFADAALDYGNMALGTGVIGNDGSGVLTTTERILQGQSDRDVIGQTVADYLQPYQYI